MIATLGLAATPGLVRAQTGADASDRDAYPLLEPGRGQRDPARGVPVRERSRPDYDPIGDLIGAFTVNSQATAKVSYDTNVFRETNGRDDVIGDLLLSAQAKSNWSRNALVAEAFVGASKQAQYSEAGNSTYGLSLQGRLDGGIGEAVTVDTSFERLAQDRIAVGQVLSTQEPTIYNRSQIGVTGRRAWGPLGVQLSANAAKYDYRDTTSLDGAPLDQQFRDYALGQVGLDVAYGTDPGRAFFMSVAGENREYRLHRPGSVNRDQQGYEILAGVRSEITPLIRGQLGIGYLHADFEEPGVKTRDVVSFDTRLSYLVTELTTVRVSGRRFMQNIDIPTATAVLVTRVAAGVDHELYRNVILSADFRHDEGDFEGVDGNSKVNFVELGAIWLIDRHYRVQANLTGSQRRSESLDTRRSIDAVVGSVSVTYRR
ncbi:outer membrane beta-barrel protein [Caulobacter hibisci]|uniref:Outer membrane beta-barrel protein n=1 Tax=Caulobacter hibisci TaxID=2035993 RepID=A0ABS0T688_9CAUL|nr:outer membrane beta-barrel protein [Caulobacter hibisci]MBI1687001.1 outer membrane beta-barrel protein [Caulobacter hibisci]